MKSRRFSTLNWITDAASVNSFIWSGSLDMKVLMKKLLGYPPTNLLMLLTLSPISIPNILPNLAQFPFNKSVHFPFLYFPFTNFLSCSTYLFCFRHFFSVSHFPSYLHLFFGFRSYFPFHYSHQNKVKIKQKNISPSPFYDTLYILRGRSGGFTIRVLSPLFHFRFSISFSISFSVSFSV